MSRTSKPSNLKLIEGNRGKRAKNNAEPDPDYLNDLTAPGWLPDIAKTVWNEVAPELRKVRLLTTVDVQALGMACIAIAQYRLAVEKAGNDLVQITSAKEEKPDDGKDQKPQEKTGGGQMINPWLMVQSMSFKQAMAVLTQFGMTPASRTRVVSSPQQDLFSPNGNSKKTSYLT
jgi:P27 family predicted phage terminase small subunit